MSTQSSQVAYHPPPFTLDRKSILYSKIPVQTEEAYQVEKVTTKRAAVRVTSKPHVVVVIFDDDGVRGIPNRHQSHQCSLRSRRSNT